MGYTRKVIEGSGYNALTRLASSVISLGKMYFLARLLSIEDFGLFSITAIALGLMESMTQTGINTIMVQSSKSIEYFLDTAWVIAIVRGFIIAVAMILLGFGLTWFYQEQKLLWLISLASFIPIIKGFINPAITNLHKQLYFFKDSAYKLSISLVEGITVVGLAFLFRSVYVFILAMIIAAIYEVVFSLLVIKPKPQFRIIKSRAKEILSYAKWLNVSAWLSYLHENLDNLLIAKLLGTTQVGIYHNAYALSHKPNFDVAGSIHHSTMPVFSRISREKERIERAFKKSFYSSSLLLAVLSLPLFLFPEFFVQLILGDKWLAVAPLLRILIFAGWIHSLALLCHSYLIALGKFKIVNYYLGISTSLMVLLMLVLAPRYGMVGALWAILIARLIAVPFILSSVFTTFSQNEN